MYCSDTYVGYLQERMNELEEALASLPDCEELCCECPRMGECEDQKDRYAIYREMEEVQKILDEAEKDNNNYDNY